LLNDKTSIIEQEISKENKPKLSYLIRLWKYVFSSAKLMCIIFISLTTFLSLLRPVLAFIWGRYIDSVSKYNVGDTIIPMILLVSSYYIINFLANLINRYTIRQEQIERLDIVQANRFQEQFDTKMYKKLSKLSPEYLEIPKINDTMSRVFGFTSDAWSGLNSSVMLQGYYIIAKAVSVISIALSLFILNPWLCFMVLIAPIPSLYTTYVGNKISFKFNKDNSKLYRETGYYQGLMLSSATKEIKAFNLFDFFFNKWKTLADELVKKEKRVFLSQTILNTASNIITSSANVGANIFAIVLLTLGQITLGTLAAVMSLISTLLQDTGILFSSIATFISKKNEAAMFFDLMDLKEQNTEGKVVSSFEEIKAENLKYRYPMTERYVLDNINLTIKKGEKVAFVGENGAGKTTFVKLISGIVTPSEGELFINGNHIDEINPVSLYSSISAVYQDPARYTTFTIADNVFIGDSKVVRNEMEIDKALSFADFTGNDKNELLGKDIGGTDLSGGQWQKLAIARGYYRNRDFIILDEPTSNLDPLAETEVFKKYIKMAENKTVIMVTHRIGVAAIADRIIVFKDGQITEDGTHEQLIDTDSEYAKLYKAQAKWYDR
jgi:ATP-binding cassette subfamily B protein